MNKKPSHFIKFDSGTLVTRIDKETTLDEWRPKAKDNPIWGVGFQDCRFGVLINYSELSWETEMPEHIAFNSIKSRHLVTKLSPSHKTLAKLSKK